MITDEKEYKEYLKQIQDSKTTIYTALPTVEPRFIINANSREITIPPVFKFLAAQYDHQAETIYFEIDRYYDNVDLSKKVCIVQYSNKGNKGDISEGFSRVTNMDTYSIDGKIIFGWSIDSNATKYVGDIEFSVRFYSIDENNEFTYNFNTLSAYSTIADSLQIYSNNDYVSPSDYELWIVEADKVDADIRQILNNVEVLAEEVERNRDLSEEHKNDAGRFLNQTMEQARVATAQASEAKTQVGLAKGQVSIATDQADEATAQASIAIAQATIATEQAELATEKAYTASTRASVSTAQAEISTQQAEVATNKAQVATEQANISTAQANESKAQAEISNAQALLSKQYSEESKAQADVSTEKANVATQQAGIATEQANISTTQAGIAKTQADISTAQATESTRQANIAKEQANISTDKANVATEQANISTSQATEATNQATLAGEKASIATSQASTATSQASIATAKATVATEQAEIATAKASEVSTQAGVATDKAELATEKANLATDKANEASTYLDDVKANADTSIAKASEATAQATIATEQAVISKQQAEIATAQANESKIQAELSKGYADEAKAQMNIAVEQATEATNQAVESKAQAELATAQAVIATEKAALATEKVNEIDSKIETLGDEYLAKTGGNIDGSLNVSETVTTKIFNSTVGTNIVEFRESESIEAGYVLIESGNGILTLSTERLNPTGVIVSDTYGFAMGQSETNTVPTVITGRVLAYPYEEIDTYAVGTVVCSAPDGKVSAMTNEEIDASPESILGVVTEIPTYETWNDVNVNGRIWIKVK